MPKEAHTKAAEHHETAAKPLARRPIDAHIAGEPPKISQMNLPK
jgi:hypothetical protein